jgi:hypothetical protein
VASRRGEAAVLALAMCQIGWRRTGITAAEEDGCVPSVIFLLSF